MTPDFSSFGDLLKYQKQKSKSDAVRNATTHAEKCEYGKALSILDQSPLSILTDQERAFFGLCASKAAAQAVADLDWKLAEHRLKQAINWGFKPWNVERRMQLVRDASTGRTPREPRNECFANLKTAPEVGAARTPLEFARQSGTLITPVKPLWLNFIDDHYCLGVYRWRGDPDASNQLSRMIRMLKKQQCPDIVETLAYLLTVGVRQEKRSIPLSADVLVPVPRDPKRLKERGFDNIRALAQDFERFCALPLADSALDKAPTRDLRTLANASDRRRELAGSITPGPRARDVKGAVVLLVDDVITTGATITLCAEVLRQAGATGVYAVALALSESTVQSEKWGT